MDVTSLIAEFSENGWFIHDVENIDEIINSRNTVVEFLRSQYSIQGKDDAEILNNIHNYIPNLDDVKANALVVNILSSIGKKLDIANAVYNSSSEMISNLVGCDIACQRFQNIVFQYPGSNRYSELHTDAPNNSRHEIVYWLPLVDCYQTKSFYLVNAKNTKMLLTQYKENKFESWDDFKMEAISLATHLEIKFGQILGFWSGLLHGSLINNTNESRFSYNMRFKNLYAPSGLKDPLVFYEPFKISKLTEYAIDI